MIPDIAKDAGSILHFKRKSNAFADAEGALEIPCHFCKLKKRNDTCEKNLILM